MSVSTLMSPRHGFIALAAGLLALTPAMALAQHAQDSPQGSPPSGGDPHGGQPSSGGSHGGDPHGGPHGGGQAYGGGHPGMPQGGGYRRGWSRPGRIYVPVVDRGHPGWWRGNPAFVGYFGFRGGYYYAPGYGYYAIPQGYAGTAWVVGVTLPLAMRRYTIVAPAAYGLAPPPPGYGWFYAGTNLVLVSLTTGVIIQSVAGGW